MRLKISEMHSVKNQTTQPVQEFPVFNNWNEVAYGWYFLMPSADLKVREVRAFRLCGQELVVFRGEDQKVAVLDAYCPHMGTHLGKGRVVGNSVRCFFHHWQFNRHGKCEHIPCQREIPDRAVVPSYAVAEFFEGIWVYPGATPQHAPIGFADLAIDEPVVIRFGKSYERSCHHHVTMINGLDPQHLKTVHRLDIEMQVEIAEPTSGNQIDITLTGRIGERSWRERLAKFFLGPQYSYSMRYDHGNNGLLTLMRNVSFLGRRWPCLHMIFAYRPVEKGRTQVQPIYVTKKRKGLIGLLESHALLFLTKRAFFALQGEDGAVYENMRFYPANLLSIDRPVAQYIQYVNKLKVSPWKLP